MDVPVARRTANPTWVNARTVLGLLLFCLAFLGGQHILTQARATIPLWAATHSLAEGTRLTADDLAPVEVRLPGDQSAVYARADRSLEGAVLTRAVEPGELISTAWLSEGSEASAGRTLTIPVTPEHANGGLLRPGDRIDVFATFSSGAAAGCTLALGHGLEVVEMVSAGGLVVDDATPVGVTVATTPQEAARLALAVRTADIDVARVTGESGLSAPASVCAVDLR